MFGSTRTTSTARSAAPSTSMRWSTTFSTGTSRHRISTRQRNWSAYESKRYHDPRGHYGKSRHGGASYRRPPLHASHQRGAGRRPRQADRHRERGRSPPPARNRNRKPLASELLAATPERG